MMGLIVAKLCERKIDLGSAVGIVVFARDEFEVAVEQPKIRFGNRSIQGNLPRTSKQIVSRGGGDRPLWRFFVDSKLRKITAGLRNVRVDAVDVLGTHAGYLNIHEGQSGQPAEGDQFGGKDRIQIRSVGKRPSVDDRVFGASD